MSEHDDTAVFAAPDPASLASLFPGYEIEYLIAVGGMGAVYKAVQISLDRPVAIKILPREFGADVSYRAGFEAEAKAMARLNHPNLIGVYDFGKVDGMLFIVMEFVPGQTLYHSANGIAIAADTAARIVINVCLGLAHAHEHGILHRDIKPSNILLDQEANPKIGDFGLARPMSTVVQDGESIFGTPHYTAPEVLRSPNSVDARADIFSVGVVLHELLTGCLPAVDPRPPSAVCACDHRFDTIIRRSTHPSPHMRYASASEMAKEISAITSAVPSLTTRLQTTVPPAKRPTAVQKTYAAAAPDESNKALIIAVSCVAAAIIVALFIILKKPSTPIADTAPSTPPSSEPAPAPKPKPAPVVEQAPEPKSKPEIVEWKPDPKPLPPPDPEPEPVVAVNTPDPVKIQPAPAPLPSFDVAAFFDRARGIMRQKSLPLIAAQDKELAKNFEAFERKIKHALRQIERDTRAAMELRAEVSLTEWRTNGNRIPKTLNAPLNEKGYTDPNPKGILGYGSYGDYGFRTSLHALHPVYLAKQDLIDQKLELDFLTLSDTYILGLKMQLDKLANTNEPAAVEQIQAEIAAVKKKSSYFSCLMRGIDPNAEKVPAVRPPSRSSPTGNGGGNQ
jgi:serine/threonine protein kinase